MLVTCFKGWDQNNGKPGCDKVICNAFIIFHHSQTAISLTLNTCKNAEFKHEPSGLGTIISLTESQHDSYNLNAYRCSLSSLLRQTMHFDSLRYLEAAKLLQLCCEEQNMPNIQTRKQIAPFVVSGPGSHSTMALQGSKHHYTATCPTDTCLDKASAIKAADGSLGRLKPELAWTHHLWYC